MLFMVIFANLYSFIINLVPLNLCFSHDDTYDHSSTGNTHRYIATSITFGVEFIVLWDYIPLFGVFDLVSMKIFSIFTMSRLTQTQKALFLWRTPSKNSKKAWYKFYYCINDLQNQTISEFFDFLTSFSSVSSRFHIFSLSLLFWSVSSWFPLIWIWNQSRCHQVN